MKKDGQLFKRRQYLINPGFQLRFMLYWAGFILIGFAVMYLSNYLYFDSVYQMGYELDLDESHPYFAFIDQQKVILRNIYLALSAISFTVVMVAGLFLSHKIAGPIYRIERYMEGVANGHEKPAPVHLRQGDFFPEIEGIVNHTIKHYEDILKRLESQKAEILRNKDA